MTTIVKIFATCLVGCALGLLLTAALVARGPVFGAIRAGAWTSFPRAGDAADPYTLATYARSAEIPLGSGEGLSFIARTADDGTQLRRSCSYVLNSGTIPARAWTLTVLTSAGQLAVDGTIRDDFTSNEILRTTDGHFSIAIAGDARPGNWLPLGADKTEAFVLMLRLYDTVLSTAGALDAGVLPALVREGCA